MKSGSSFIIALVLFACGSSSWALPATYDATGQAAASTGSAGGTGFSPTYIACMKSAGGNLLGSDACMTSELKYQDARLNKAYKALLGVLEPEAKKALVEAERAWLKSQSGDEDFESALYGDTQAGNAQQLENRLGRLCARANALDKYLALAEL